MDKIITLIMSYNTNEMGGAYNTFPNTRLCHKLLTGNCAVQEQLVYGCGYGHVL